MRKNRKIPKRLSVAANITMYAGMNVLMLFVVTVVYMLGTSSCTQLMTEAGKLEKELSRYEDDRQREESRWQELNNEEQLRQAFVKCGISAAAPTHSQIIRIGKNGRPIAGQASIKKIRERLKGMASLGQFGDR